MFRKLTGICILLCFLLVKNSPLYLFDSFKHSISFSTSESEKSELPEENKTTKHFESADEEFIHQSVESVISVLSLSKRLDFHYNKQTSTAYFSLPHPPPDGNS